MLKKLLKYEFKATATYLLPIYAIVLGISVFSRILSVIPIFQDTLLLFARLFQVGQILSLIACGALTMIFLVLRFYNNLITDEGYLMHTLPVNTDQLIITKLLSSFVWIFTTIVVILGSIAIAYATPERMQYIFNELYEGILYMFEYSTVSSVTFFIITFLIVIFGAAQTILMVYLSISCGQLFGNHRVIGSFASYAAINTVTSIVSTIAISITALLQDHNDIEQYLNKMSMENILWGYLIISLIFVLFWGCVFYLGTRYLLKNKLNLE